MMSEKKRGRPAAAKKNGKVGAVKKAGRKTGSVKRGVTTSITATKTDGQHTKVLKAQHKRELSAEKSKTLSLQKALKSVHQAITKALGGSKTTKSKSGAKRRGRPKA